MCSRRSRNPVPICILQFNFFNKPTAPTHSPPTAMRDRRSYSPIPIPFYPLRRSRVSSLNNSGRRVRQASTDLQSPIVAFRESNRQKRGGFPERPCDGQRNRRCRTLDLFTSGHSLGRQKLSSGTPTMSGSCGLHSTARVTQRIATVSQAYRRDSRVRPTVARALAMRRRFSYTESH